MVAKVQSGAVLRFNGVSLLQTMPRVRMQAAKSDHNFAVQAWLSKKPPEVWGLGFRDWGVNFQLPFM